MKLEKFLNNDVVNFNLSYKKRYFLKRLKHLTQLHYNKCKEYKNILSYNKVEISKIKSLDDLPFLPSKIFKDYLLLSIKKSEIFKVLNSSGTSGNSLSKIVLDRKTSIHQIKVLTKITKSLIGHSRLPTIIIDSKTMLKDNQKFSARQAGVVGFNNFSKDTIYALDENMKLDIENLIKFFNKYKNEKIFIFGFTYLIYEKFIQQLIRLKIKLNIQNAIMIHGGGWKKLADLNITNNEFKKLIKKQIGIKNVYNYYGMVEQTGSIFIECKKGNFHTSLVNDIIVRNKQNNKISKIGEKGVVQVISLIPESYPGHSILTEDEGIILGKNNCGCGKKGKYFKILGRIKNSEIRGCSDVYQ